MSTKASPRDIIVSPVVSEKSYSLLDGNWYTFLVHPKANKTEVRQAIEAIWDVKVERVNTLSRKGKSKRFRFSQGRRSDTKRAIVKLAEGDKIEIFEA
jgi:large subunit ribosomal protein L23